MGEMTKVTRLEDAKALRNMGVPLNTPVEDRMFTPKVGKLWVKTWECIEKLDAMNGGTATYTAAVKLYNRLNGLCGKLDACIPTVDEREGKMIAAFLVQKALPLRDELLASIEQAAPNPKGAA